MIDHAEIIVKAGRGGNGAVDFGRRKGKTFGPPVGGDGGRGGDVLFVAVPHTTTLAEFRYKKIYEAEKGGRGGGNQRHGENGEALIIKVPQGTVINDAKSGVVLIDMADTKEPVLIAQGGKGGRGNMHMRKYAAHASRPVEWERWGSAEDGVPGEEKELRLELKLIADIGLVGLPNAGKSTLLSVITAAKPKIADYPFTTLEPNLGVWYMKDYSFVVADIPGLIEGASKGKGLGEEFLRHVERTKVLIHLTQSVKEYNVVRKELEQYSIALAKKPEIVVLAKMDILSPKDQKDRLKAFESLGILVLPISAVAHEGLDDLAEKVLPVLLSQ